MPRPRMAFSLGKSTNMRLSPKISIDSRWINARMRTFEPQEQLAGSVANTSTVLQAPQMLQVNEVTTRILSWNRTVFISAHGHPVGENPIRRFEGLRAPGFSGWHRRHWR